MHEKKSIYYICTSLPFQQRLIRRACEYMSNDRAEFVCRIPRDVAAEVFSPLTNNACFLEKAWIVGQLKKLFSHGDFKKIV